MNSVSQKVEEHVAVLASLALEYGVHGRIHGPFAGSVFQVTRVNSKWTLYVSKHSGPQLEILGAKVDEKLLFLEQAATIDKAYRDRIREVYGQLQKLG